VCEEAGDRISYYGANSQEVFMVVKKRLAARRPPRRKAPTPRKPPEGWIRVVWIQVVHPRLAPDESNLRLSLKPRRGKPRTITLTYEQTKKLLPK
jgi:hypothetical protein